MAATRSATRAWQAEIIKFYSKSVGTSIDRSSLACGSSWLRRPHVRVANAGGVSIGTQMGVQRIPGRSESVHRGRPCRTGPNADEYSATRTLTQLPIRTRSGRLAIALLQRHRLRVSGVTSRSQQE